MKVFQGIYRVWVTILTAAVVLQIFFAGYGAFDAVHKLDKDGSTIDQDGFNYSFDLHIALGYLIWLGGIIFLLISFGTRTAIADLSRARRRRPADPSDPARLDRLRRPVRRGRAAPDERVHHPRLPRLDHVSRVEGPGMDSAEAAPATATPAA